MNKQMILTEESQAKLKELRESHKWCCIEIYSDYSYVWEIKLTHPGSDHSRATLRSRCHESLDSAVDEIYERALNWDGSTIDPKSMRDRK